MKSTQGVRNRRNVQVVPAGVGDLGVRVAVLAVVLGLAVAAGVWWRARNGRATTVEGGEHLTASDLGQALGDTATFVQFSGPACASCRAVHRELSGLAAAEPGVGHVEIDAAERLDLARRLGILRTPTVLVLDAAGRITTRISGALTADQARTALPDPSRS